MEGKGPFLKKVVLPPPNHPLLPKTFEQATMERCTAQHGTPLLCCSNAFAFEGVIFFKGMLLFVKGRGGGMFVNGKGCGMGLGLCLFAKVAFEFLYREREEVFEEKSSAHPLPSNAFAFGGESSDRPRYRSIQ